MKFLQQSEVAKLREIYKEGVRVELVSMNDPYTKLRAGDKGTVNHVDDAGGVHINWDNGSGLAAIIGEDIIKII